jgi:hypothetical protein
LADFLAPHPMPDDLPLVIDVWWDFVQNFLIVYVYLLYKIDKSWGLT